MFMRNGSLLVDLRGAYFRQEENGEAAVVEDHVKNFGVWCKHVFLQNLKSHGDEESYHAYFMELSEMNEVIEIIQSYISLKPYRFNMK